MIFSVYIKDMTATQILKDEKTPVISFIANTGGLIGLCIGLSSVSVFEIIFHLCKSVSSLKRSHKDTSMSVSSIKN